MKTKDDGCFCDSPSKIAISLCLVDSWSCRRLSCCKLVVATMSVMPLTTRLLGEHCAVSFIDSLETCIALSTCITHLTVLFLFPTYVGY